MVILVFLLANFQRIGPLGRFNLLVAMSVRLFYVPFHVVYFEAYFAPTSQSRMSKVFRDSESLGKSAEKEFVSELNIFVGKWSKIAAIFFFFDDFALQNMVETTLLDGLETSGQRVYC